MRDVVNPPAVVRAVEDLETLARQINEREEKGVRSLKEHGRAQGQALIQAREQAGKDRGWLKWLKENVRDISRATAYRYIAIAENWEKVLTLRTMRECLQFLAEQPETPSVPPVHSDELERWLRLVQGQTWVIETDRQGLATMRAEREKWDWSRVREIILPDMREVRDRLSGYIKELEEDASTESNGRAPA